LRKKGGGERNHRPGQHHSLLPTVSLLCAEPREEKGKTLGGREGGVPDLLEPLIPPARKKTGGAVTPNRKKNPRSCSSFSFLISNQGGKGENITLSCPLREVRRKTGEERAGKKGEGGGSVTYPSYDQLSSGKRREREKKGKESASSRTPRQHESLRRKRGGEKRKRSP